jgi:hypothetical protein
MSEEQKELETYRLFVTGVYQLVYHMPESATAADWVRLFQPVLEIARALLGDEEIARRELAASWHQEPDLNPDPGLPTWIRTGDERIGKRARTRDRLGHLIDGKVTAIVKWSNGREHIEIKQGTARTGTTTAWPAPADVQML